MTTYLSGVINPPLRAEADHPDLGILVTPDTNQYRKDIERFGTWAADNGCFSQSKPFDADRWERWLDGMPREGCLWATAPDVVGNHDATLKRSVKWLKRIRSMGFKAAFVIQNGAEPANVPWSDFDAMFIGGVPECIPCGFKRAAADFRQTNCPQCGRKLTEWKMGDESLALVVEAKRHDKPVHVGRVNTARRYRWCRDVAESDSADGTKLARDGGQHGVDDILSWLNDEQLRLV
jgi:hypothetical protein